ncbi:hypothetical protein CYLTODRAFT_121100 [Cylindrobasidium torrendii FP15055 ss-10]|uniref:Uncharacterized protein n=1 Tax=Cylindrobasidium torrendii FP15055 ss-10 TaxID=1314674 RepID=A0A0D7AZQ9_9AGAR|nr:hypothetical protein CYLTODRAFT_121100 [Cylindrobasidium torrendii FP15055 ss-10]
MARGASINHGAGGSGYNTSLRPPTMIERHMNSSPASFAYGQGFNAGPMPPAAAFTPGEIMGPAVYNDQDIRAGPYDGDPFSPANPYLMRQPSSASGMYHHEQAQQYDYQPQYTVPGHAPQYADVNRMPSPYERQSSAGEAFVAAAGVTMPPADRQGSPPNQGAPRSPSPQSAVPPASPRPGAANAHQQPRPDTAYDPSDAYGGM